MGYFLNVIAFKSIRKTKFNVRHSFVWPPPCTNTDDNDNNKTPQIIQEQVIKNDFLHFINDTLYRTLILYDVYHSTLHRE